MVLKSLSSAGCGRKTTRLLGFLVIVGTTLLAKSILTNQQGIKAEKLSGFYLFIFSLEIMSED